MDCPIPVTSWKYNDGSELYRPYSSAPMLPLRRPWRLSRSAMMPDHSGEDRLVPPIWNQPADAEPGHPPAPVAAGPVLVQYSAYPVYGSASAEMSGSSRHGVPTAASEQCVVPFPYVV